MEQVRSAALLKGLVVVVAVVPPQLLLQDYSLTILQWHRDTLLSVDLPDYWRWYQDHRAFTVLEQW